MFFPVHNKTQPKFQIKMQKKQKHGRTLLSDKCNHKQTCLFIAKKEKKSLSW